MYQRAVAGLLRAADQVGEYRADLAAFADSLAGKKWGTEVTGPLQDMDTRLTAIEGTYRDLAAQMKHQGDQGAGAYDQAPWIPGPEAVTESYAAMPDLGNDKHFLEADGAQEDSFMPDNETKGHREPSRTDVRRGGRFGQHVLPDRADDMLVERLVRVVFKPQPMFPGLPCKEPCDPVLVQQLLDHSPQTDRTGVDDWDRPLRADEIADIYGTPMEGDPLDVRIAWLRRADELCRAWGKPLAGPGGLVPDMTLPAKGNSHVRPD